MPEFKVTDLDALRRRRVKVDNTIRNLQKGIANAQRKFSEYSKLIQDPTIPDSGGEQYNVKMLEMEQGQIRQGILDAEEVLRQELIELTRLDSLILEGERIVGNYGDCTGTGQTHDWQILEMFDIPRLAHQWKRRQCRKCKAVQKLGND